MINEKAVIIQVFSIVAVLTKLLVAMKLTGLPCSPLSRINPHRNQRRCFVEGTPNLTTTSRLTSLLIWPRCKPSALWQFLSRRRRTLFFTVIRPLRNVLLDGFLQSFLRTFIHKTDYTLDNKLKSARNSKSLFPNNFAVLPIQQETAT